MTSDTIFIMCVTLGTIELTFGVCTICWNMQHDSFIVIHVIQLPNIIHQGFSTMGNSLDELKRHKRVVQATKFFKNWDHSVVGMSNN